MKKVYLIAAGLMFSALGLKAQSSGISFGIKAGFNYSNQISSDNSYKTDFIPGFNAGITTNIPIVNRLSFAPELLLSSKGYKVQYDNALFGKSTGTSRTINIDVPILANINIINGLNVQVGPQVSFLLNTKNTLEDSNGTSISQEKSNAFDDKNTYRGSIVSGVVGASYNVTKNINIHARYNLDLQKNNKDGSSSDPKYKNQVYQVGLGYTF